MPRCIQKNHCLWQTRLFIIGSFRQPRLWSLWNQTSIRNIQGFTSLHIEYRLVWAAWKRDCWPLFVWKRNCHGGGPEMNTLINFNLPTSGLPPQYDLLTECCPTSHFFYCAPVCLSKSRNLLDSPEPYNRIAYMLSTSVLLKFLSLILHQGSDT